MGHLPNGGEILGAVNFLTPERGAQADIQPTYLVSTVVVQHWVHRNEYPMRPKNVNTRVEKIYQEFCLVSKLIKKGNPSEKTLQRYDNLITFRDETSNISIKNDKQGLARKEELERQFVKMSKAEIDYLENQKDTSIARTSERKLLCFPKKNDIDPVWEKQETRREKYAEYAEKKKEEQSQQFQQESYELSSDKENFDTDFENENLDVDAESAENEQNLSSCSKKRWRSYIAVPEDEDDLLSIS